jgi:hypothetical protein
MKLNLKNQQNLMQRLRYVAEKHPDDVIANTASSLAYRMEAMRDVVDTAKWDDTDQEIANYAIAL